MKIKEIYFSFLAVFATIGGAVAQALGGWDTALQTLIVVIAVDYITGLLCAIIWKRSPKTASGALESRQSIKGLFKKGCMLLVVLVAVKLDVLTGTDFLRNTVILFFVANDGISIIENLGIMGLPMPKALKNCFEALKNKGESEG